MYFVSPYYFASTPMWLFCITAFINSSGGYLIGIIFAASIRDYTPKDKVGQFQGVRIFFAVMIPMCVGPFITAFINTSNQNSIIGIDEYGNNIYIYQPEMFLIAAFLVLLALIPAVLIRKYEKSELIKI
jgi:MFS family permease